DEPTDGLDPLAREDFAEILAEHLSESPTTVLISTHLVHEVEGLGDHLGVIRKGRLVAQLPREQLSRRLHRVRALTPEGWTAPKELEAAVLGSRAARREVQWTVSGAEEEIAQALVRSGATVQEIRSLNLEEASRALLRMEVER
ncbi:MAG: hypothetical protein KDD47_13295, partial [Acidobacteria bacterium]|nr:hypothetical protein [Acidobacteriota bacterium]